MGDKKKKKAQDKLKDYTDNVDSWYSYYNEHIERARNFKTFLYVDQWELQIRQARDALSKPTMQFNKLVSIVRAILGEQRENSPQLAVRGINDTYDQTQINLRTDLIRQISYASDSDVVYQLASKDCLEAGWGAVYVTREYENENTFNQCVKIKAIQDYQSAFWDPTAQEPDKSDGDFCGFYKIMSKDDFKRLYPDIETPESFVNNFYISWNSRDTILVAHLWKKEFYTKKLVQLSDGNELDADDAKIVLDKQEEMMLSNPDIDLLGFEPLEIVNEREVQAFKIKYVKFIQNNILDEAEWPGKYLPVVYFEGDSVVIDGERIPIPYIQDAIDTQKLINYCGSEIAYAILRSRREQVIGTPDNFAGHEEIWRNPNQVQGPLIAERDEAGQLPQFVNPPPFQPELLTEYQSASQDLQQILGRYEESRGQQSNAISGVAIAKRQQASSMPVNVYDDNWQRGIKRVGKIVMDLIPYTYDTERQLSVTNVEGKTKSVMVNQQKGYQFSDDGKIEPNVMNDLTAGEYDIEVRVDGSFEQQKSDAMRTLIDLAAINPAIGNLIPDLIAETSGLENAQKITERLKTLLPPELLAKENGEPPPPPPAPPPPDPAIIIAQLKAMLGLKDLELKNKKLILDDKKIELDAQAHQLDTAVADKKADAEMQKASEQTKQAFIDHVGAVTKAAQANNNNNQQAMLTQKVEEAQIRRADLDAQSQSLKSMGI